MEISVNFDVEENGFILLKAGDFSKEGIKAKDALHIACAIEAECDYLLTTDDAILKKMSGDTEIKIFNPIDFIKIIETL